MEFSVDLVLLICIACFIWTALLILLIVAFIRFCPDSYYVCGLCLRTYVCFCGARAHECEASIREVEHGVTIHNFEMIERDEIGHSLINGAVVIVCPIHKSYLQKLTVSIHSVHLDSAQPDVKHAEESYGDSLSEPEKASDISVPSMGSPTLQSTHVYRQRQPLYMR